MTGSAPDAVLPCPVFEGSEKRISVFFKAGTSTPAEGLRALTRSQLDGLLDLAACQIVSTRSNPHFDAYVLSESSLFVYPDRMVLKTCGTTKLLSCVPHMLVLASSLGMAPAAVKYSRASFLFPEQQPSPHTSFDEECDVLRKAFAGLLAPGAAYVMGDGLRGLQWHVFVAGAAPLAAPLLTLEVCMTGLSPAKAAQFFRTDAFVSAQHTTQASGIQALVPRAAIDDYVFEPCGYSMNGIDGAAFSTIHITPEDHCSYASFELCGYDGGVVNAADLVARVADVFQPRNLCVALSCDAPDTGATAAATAAAWGAAFAAPAGYACGSASHQELDGGGCVAYFAMEGGAASSAVTDVAVAGPALPLSLPACKPASSNGSDSDSGSPRAVIKHFPSVSGATSLASGTSVLTDMDLLAGSDNASENASDNASMRNGLCGSLLVDPAELGVEDVLALHAAQHLPRGDVAGIDEHARRLIAEHALEDNFYVVDLGALQRLYRAWDEAMPRVHPHYAVKCNPDPAILATLAALGAGFDCASEAEVRTVLGLGVRPDRIVFANPCKRPRDMRCAAETGVELTTFDSEAELAKLARFAPDARVLLRIRADDPGARCQLGNKYGAQPHEWSRLLGAAAALGVPVVGVAFHVGSGAKNPAAFSQAIALARAAWDMATAQGFDMRVLDIGGGFCGGCFDDGGLVDLGGVPEAVNAALAQHFPETEGLRVIAEPGRFFAESVATMGCLVYGRRVRTRPVVAGQLVAAASDAEEVVGYDYWVTDGLYGSMNSVLYDHATLSARPLLASGVPPLPRTYPSTVFGPTCDGLDTLMVNTQLPELQVGDWLLFPAMGAYTLCGASKFNGIDATAPATFYVNSAQP